MPQTWTDPTTGDIYDLVPDTPKAKTWTDPKTGDIYDLVPDTPAPAKPSVPKKDKTTGVISVDKGSLLPENYREIPKEYADMTEALSKDIADAAASGLDAKKAGAALFKKYKGVWGSPEVLEKNILYKRSPWGNLPTQFTYKEDGPEITVEAKKKNFTGLERTAVDLYDQLQGIKQGAMQMGEGVPEIIARGLDASGLTDDSLSVIDRSKDLIHRNDQPIDPLSGQFGAGEFIGEMSAGMPLTMFAPFARALPGSKAAELMDTALQGAAGQVLATGGENPVENAAMGALGGAALHAGIGSLAAPFSKIDFSPEGIPLGKGEAPVEALPETRIPTKPEETLQPYGTTRTKKAQEARVKDVSDRVENTIKGWEGRPEVNVVYSARQLPEEVQAGLKADKAMKAQAFVDSEGRINILANNIEHPDDVAGIVYHEALGHRGLANVFREKLDGTLYRIYDSNWNYRKQADEWLKNNKTAYPNLSPRLRTVRALEEVLAEASEKGRIKPTVREQISRVLRSFGRKIGLSLRYSDREVKAILGGAHDSVITGNGLKEPGSAVGNRYIRRDNRTERGKHVDDFIKSVKEEMPDRTMTEKEALDRMESMYGAPSKVMRKKMEVDPTLGPKAMQVTEDAINKSLAIGKKIISRDASEKEMAEYAYQIARAADWAAKIEGYKSDLGRALRMLQLVSEGKTNLSNVDIGQLGNPDYLYKLATALENGAADPKMLADTLKTVYKPSALDKVTSFRYAMMLSSPASHMKNLVGNVTMMAADLVEHAGASLLGMLRGASTEDKIVLKEVGMKFYGMTRALADGSTWSDVAKSWEQAHPTHMVSKIEDSKVVLPGFLSGPQRSLAAVDSLFRSIIENGYYYSSAYRIASEEGLKGVRLADRIDELVRNPTDEMVKWADRQAAVLQLVDEPSLLSQGVSSLAAKAKRVSSQQKLEGKSGAVADIMHFGIQNAIPFLRVRDRLFFSAVRRSPFAAFDRVWREDFMAGGSRRDLAVSQMVIGSTIVGLLTYKAMKGELSGPLDMDMKKISKNAEDQAAGIQPNSIKFNGKWYPLDGFDLFSTLGPVVAEAVQSYKENKDDGTFVGKVWNITGDVAKSLRDTSALKAIGDFYGQTMGDERGVTGYAKNTVTSFIPSGLRYANQFYDTKVRQTDGSLEERVKAAIPGLSDKLPQKYDVLGRPIEKEGRTLTGLLQAKTEDTSPVMAEIRRLSDANHGKVVVGPVRKDDLQKAIEKAGLPVKVDSEMVSQYQHIAGYNIKLMMEEFVKDKDWMSQSDKDKLKDIQKGSSDIRKATREMIVESLSQ